MDAYISEAQVTSCDSVDLLHTDIIQPGHKTILWVGIHCPRKLNDKDKSRKALQTTTNKTSRHRRENADAKESRNTKNKTISGRLL